METPASCATSRVLPRRLASAPRYCLHCFSLSIVCIWWYSCSIDNFSILPMLASFPHYCQIICGSPLSEGQLAYMLPWDCRLQGGHMTPDCICKRICAYRASHQPVRQRVTP